MSGHTPGPWIERVETATSEEPVWWIYATHPEVGEVSHAEVRSGCDEADEIGSMAANARLIAAAPELLEALEGMAAVVQMQQNIERVRNGKDDPKAWDSVLLSARAAIAKATGAE